MYLTGHEAIDVSRITGLPLRSVVHRAWEPSDIAPSAIASPEAAHRVYLDVGRLPWVDQMRVALTRIGVHYYLDTEDSCRQESQRSSASDSSAGFSA